MGNRQWTNNAWQIYNVQRSMWTPYLLVHHHFHCCYHNQINQHCLNFWQPTKSNLLCSHRRLITCKMKLIISSFKSLKGLSLDWKSKTHHHGKVIVLVKGLLCTWNYESLSAENLFHIGGGQLRGKLIGLSWVERSLSVPTRKFVKELLP